MNTAQLVGKKPEEEVGDKVISEYRSVLGAVAYAAMTQYHLLIYVVAAQRRSRTPQAVHCRRLNALLSHMKAYPRFLLFRARACSRPL